MLLVWDGAKLPAGPYVVKTHRDEWFHHHTQAMLKSEDIIKTSRLFGLVCASNAMELVVNNSLACAQTYRLGSKEVPQLFSQNVMRTLVNNAGNDKTFLHKAALHAVCVCV